MSDFFPEDDFTVEDELDLDDMDFAEYQAKVFDEIEEDLPEEKTIFEEYEE
jgi:hypothetical protein